MNEIDDTGIEVADRHKHDGDGNLPAEAKGDSKVGCHGNEAILESFYVCSRATRNSLEYQLVEFTSDSSRVSRR